MSTVTAPSGVEYPVEAGPWRLTEASQRKPGGRYPTNYTLRGHDRVFVHVVYAYDVTYTCDEDWLVSLGDHTTDPDELPPRGNRYLYRGDDEQAAVDAAVAYMEDNIPSWLNAEGGAQTTLEST